MQFSQPAAVRTYNTYRVLNLIARSGELSRADAARELGLNKVSISEIVDLLIAQGLIAESGKRSLPTAGRRPVDLELQKDARTVIAIDLGLRNTTVSMVNLAGDPLRFERFPTPASPIPEEMCALLIRSANKIMSRMKDPSIVKGMAVSLGGVVEPATGTVVSYPDWDWQQVPLSMALSKHLPFPVLLENSVTAMAAGERWFGQAAHYRSVFYIDWGDHINAAWIVDGKVVTNDCQFAHLPMARTGLCHCGAIGCLETVASGWALTEQALAQTKESSISIKQLGARAEFDPFFDGMLRKAAEAMAHASISAAAILRPERIIVGGSLCALPEVYLGALLEAYQRKAPKRILESTVMEKATLGDKAGYLGTAAMALDKFIFKRTILEQLKRQQGL